MFRLLTLTGALALIVTLGRAGAAELSRLTIDSGRGAQTFNVELATTPDQMQVGLMFRQNLAPDAGMLFVYPSEQQVAFWMKNTVIPLDMLFIAGDGKIRRIVERTIPLSTAVIPSVDEVRAVLEVNGGTAARLGITAGRRRPRRGLGKSELAFNACERNSVPLNNCFVVEDSHEGGKKVAPDKENSTNVQRQSRP